MLVLLPRALKSELISYKCSCDTYSTSPKCHILYERSLKDSSDVSNAQLAWLAITLGLLLFPDEDDEDEEDDDDDVDVTETVELPLVGAALFLWPKSS